MIKLMSYVVAFFIVMQSVSAQQRIKPEASGVLLEKGIKLHDEKKYKEAIALYKQINRNDTNYSSALHELSLSYYSDSNFIEAKKNCRNWLKILSGSKRKMVQLNCKRRR